MIGFIIGLIIVGLIAGFIARAIVPGDDSMSIPKTILLGIIGSIIGAVIVLLVYNAVTKRSAISRR